MTDEASFALLAGLGACSCWNLEALKCCFRHCSWGLIFGGAYYWKEFCASKWVGLNTIRTASTNSPWRTSVTAFEGFIVNTPFCSHNLAFSLTFCGFNLMTKSQISSGHCFANIHLKKLGWDPSIQVSFLDLKLFITRVFNCYGATRL